MIYKTLGITGNDLLLMSDNLLNEYLDRITTLSENEILSLTLELQINNMVLSDLKKDGKIEVDSSTPAFKSFENQLDNYSDKFLMHNDSIFDNIDDMDFMSDSVEESSLFSDGEDEDLMDILEDVSKSEIIMSENSNTEKSLSSQCKDRLNDYIAKSKTGNPSEEQLNFLGGLIYKYNQLPLKFKDGDIEDKNVSEKDKEIEKYTKRMICLLAQNSYKINELLKAIYRSSNRFLSPIGVPNNMSFKTDRGLKSLIYNAKNVMKSSLSEAQINDYKIKIEDLMNPDYEDRGKVHMYGKQDEIWNSFVDDVQHIYGIPNPTKNNISYQLTSGKQISSNLLFYYRFYFDTREKKVTEVFDGDINKYISLELNVAETALNKYGVLGLLPNQRNELIRNFNSMPSFVEAQRRILDDMDRSILTIIRNSLVSNSNFRIRRRV